MQQQEPLTVQDRRDALALWHYHRLGHEPRPCDAAIALGSHDIGVATHAAALYHRGFFPVVVFTGGSTPTTRHRFPRGEAVHYREHARALGVPDSAILLEPEATNTGANIVNSRAVLAAAGYRPHRVLLISKPYAQRRSFATARRLWPEVEVVCAAMPIGYGAYVRSIGDERLVVDMMVGDLHRILDYPARGFTVPQEVPLEVLRACGRLRAAGFTGRPVPPE